MNYGRTAYVVLGILAIESGQSGYEIRKTIEGTVGFFWGESYGQLYPTLKKLTADVLITARKPKSGTRQEYSITPAGRAALAKWLALPYRDDPPRDEFLLKLFFGHEAAPSIALAHLRDFQQKHRHRSGHTPCRSKLISRARSSPNFPVSPSGFSLYLWHRPHAGGAGVVRDSGGGDRVRWSAVTQQQVWKNRTRREKQNDRSDRLDKLHEIPRLGDFSRSSSSASSCMPSACGPARFSALWFVGTQRPVRGFVWLMLFAAVPSLVESLVRNTHASSRATLVSVAWILIAAFLSVWPLTFHRVVSPLLPGILKTLPFPLAAAMSMTFASLLFPAAIFNDQFSMRGSFPLAQIAAVWGIGVAFLVKDWIAALVVWIWNRDFKFGFDGGPSIAAILSIVVLSLGVCFELRGLASPSDYAGFLTLWEFLPAALFFAALALLLARRRLRRKAPSHKTLDLLRSPVSLEPLLLLEEHDLQVLASPAGERFPIRNGIPMLLRSADMTGLNRKYNHLYETIGGFYDDIAARGLRAERASIATTT